MSSPPYITPRKLAEEYNIPYTSLIKYVGDRRTNGLAPSVYKIGRKILMDRDGFLRWTRTQPPIPQTCILCANSFKAPKALRKPAKCYSCWMDS